MTLESITIPIKLSLACCGFSHFKTVLHIKQENISRQCALLEVDVIGLLDAY